MSTTAYHYKKVKDLERLAEMVGLRVADQIDTWRHNASSELCLVTFDEHLPVFTRDISLMRGTAEELTAFVVGWLKAIEYLTVLKATDKSKIQRKEQDYRNSRLLKEIKGEKDAV
jgi:hypothetical protein